MILNTKYHDIREIVNKKLEEFFSSLDQLESFFNINEIQNINLNNNDEDLQMKDTDINEENDDLKKNNKNKNDNIENSKIYLSTSQIMTKILLGNY